MAGAMLMSATRERAEFQGLARAELPGLYALARRLCRHDAEDLVQECLLRAYRSFALLRDRDAAGVWLRVMLAFAVVAHAFLAHRPT